MKLYQACGWLDLRPGQTLIRSFGKKLKSLVALDMLQHAYQLKDDTFRHGKSRFCFCMHLKKFIFKS